MYYYTRAYCFRKNDGKTIAIVEGIFIFVGDKQRFICITKRVMNLLSIYQHYNASFKPKSISLC